MSKAIVLTAEQQEQVKADRKFVSDNLIVVAKSLKDAYVKITDVASRAARVACLEQNGTILMEVYVALADQPKVQNAIKAWVAKFYPFTFVKVDNKERFKWSQKTHDEWPGGFELLAQYGASRAIGLEGTLPKKEGKKADPKTRVEKFAKFMASFEDADEEDLNNEEKTLLDHLRHADAMSKDYSVKLALANIIRQATREKNKENLDDDELVILKGLLEVARIAALELS